MQDVDRAELLPDKAFRELFLLYKSKKGSNLRERKHTT